MRTRFLSVDPYMRGRMRDVASYAPPVGLGETMPGGVVGEVVVSNNKGFKPGDIVEVIANDGVFIKVKKEPDAAIHDRR